METRPPSLRYAWYVVLALTAIYMLSYMDRVILSLLVAPMKRDFGISDTQVGLMQGLAFAMFYTLVGLPMGRIADTRNRRNLIAVGVVLWSCFTATALPVSLCVARNTVPWPPRSIGFGSIL